MISQEEILEMSRELIKIYEEIEDDLIINIAKRFSIEDEITGITEWQSEKLRQLGSLRQDTLKIIAQQAKRTDKEIADILKNAGFRTLQDDEAIYQAAFGRGLLPYSPLPVRASPVVEQIIQAAINNTRSFMNTINTTASESSIKSFLRVINQTYLETSLGIYDYNTSIKKAVRELADEGIKGASYVSDAGKETFNRLDVAVRRCILTSSTQTTGVLQIERAKEWGSNLVEVTSHIGARPSHAVWQGRIYMIHGSSDKYPNLYMATGYGTVTGLKGANCAHDFYPFFEGISEQTYKPYGLKENERVYNQSQRQRQLERDVRQLKRRVLAADAAGVEEMLKKSQLALKEKERELKAFVAKTGRTQRVNRQQINEFGQSPAMKAVWADRKQGGKV